MADVEKTQDLNSLFSDVSDSNGEEAAVDAGDVVIAETGGKKKKSGKSAEEAQIKKAYVSFLKENPDQVGLISSRSQDFEVVKVLGFGDKGNLIADKTSGDRKLVTTSKNIGYIVKNLSDKPIEYRIEEWTENDGEWSSTIIDKEMAPGEEVCFPRKWMTYFAMKPEISFTLANGKMTKGSNKQMELSGTLSTQTLEAFHFIFNKNPDGTSVSVNDDEIKLNVGERGADDKWVVKKEYEQTFGYLNTKPAQTKKPLVPQHAYALAMRKMDENSNGIIQD